MFRQHFERKIERKAPVRAEQWQSLILRQSYQLNSNPSERERTEIAKETGLDKLWIKDWFQRQRRLTRHHFLKAVKVSTPTPAESPTTIDSRSSSCASTDPVAHSTPTNPEQYNHPRCLSISAHPAEASAESPMHSEPSPASSMEQSSSSGYVPATFSAPLFEDNPTLDMFETINNSQPDPGMSTEHTDTSTSFAPPESLGFYNLFTEFAHLSPVYPPLEQNFPHPNNGMPFDVSFTLNQDQSMPPSQHTKAKNPPHPIFYTVKLSELKALARQIHQKHKEETSRALQPHHVNVDNPGNPSNVNFGHATASGKENISLRTENAKGLEPATKGDGDIGSDHGQEPECEGAPSSQTRSPSGTFLKRSSSGRVLRPAKRRN